MSSDRRVTSPAVQLFIDWQIKKKCLHFVEMKVKTFTMQETVGKVRNQLIIVLSVFWQVHMEPSFLFFHLHCS